MKNRSLAYTSNGHKETLMIGTGYDGIHALSETLSMPHALYTAEARALFSSHGYLTLFIPFVYLFIPVQECFIAV